MYILTNKTTGAIRKAKIVSHENMVVVFKSGKEYITFTNDNNGAYNPMYDVDTPKNIAHKICYDINTQNIV